MKMTKGDKTRQKPASPSKRLRDQKILADSIEGKTQTEIARDVGLSRQRVNEILNSDQMRDLAAQYQSELMQLGSLALETVRDAMSKRALDMGTAVKAALPVLNGLGILKAQGEIAHTHTHQIKNLSNEELLRVSRQAVAVLERAERARQAASHVSEAFIEGEEHA